MNILTVSPPVELVSAVMMVTVALTYLTIISRAKILGVINMSLCIALSIELITDLPTTTTVNLVAIGFAGLGLFNGYYALFGKD